LAETETEPPRFTDVGKLLDYVFALEARVLYPKAGTEFSQKGTNPIDVTPIEEIAEGSMFGSMCCRYAGRRGWIMICAYYRRPAGAVLRKRHLDDCERAQQFLRSYFRQKKRRGYIPSKWLSIDYCRDWSLYATPDHTPDEWAKRKDIARSTAYLWRRRYLDLLTSWRQLAEWRIEPEAVKGGLI